MFGISYDTWKEICDMYFSLNPKIHKAYLQWFPFSKLSEQNKKEISGVDFFDKYIKSGGFVLFSEVMRHSENFIQKSDGSFRNSSLISPLLFLIIQAVGKEIFDKYVSQRQSGIEVYYAGNYGMLRPRYKQDYDDFYKSINLAAQQHRYYIKTDVTDFFNNIKDL